MDRTFGANVTCVQTRLGFRRGLSAGSRTVTERYRAAPFQGWSVPLTPAAEGSALLTFPDTAQ